MLHKEQPKLKLDKSKPSLNGMCASKAKSGTRFEPRHQKVSSSQNKHNNQKFQNSPTIKPRKSKSKLDHAISIGKSLRKTEKKEHRQRLVSELNLNEFEARQTKSQEKNEMKYIFNTIPTKHKVKFNSEGVKQRTSPLLSHSKCHSNLTLTKHSYHIKNDAISSFGKTNASDFTKIKKKKHEYIKKFNKTSNFEKSLSSGFQTIDFIHPSSLTGKDFERMASIQSANGLQKQSIEFEVTDQDLENLQIEGAVPKISQIRHNVSSLFKKLKSPSKAKLLLISNNYEKIVSDLFTALKNPILPNCDISRINTNSSDQQNAEEKENQIENLKFNINSFKPSINNSANSYQKTAHFNTPEAIRQVTAEVQSSSDGTSDHWDSYMNLNSQQIIAIQKAKIIQKEKNTISKEKSVKKLNLHAINKPGIKQYQEEFMENKEGFSESWKREISQQARY